MLPEYKLNANLPPLILPTLSVNVEGRVHVPYALIEKLLLHNKQAIDLVPPQSGSDYWHLDVRPEAQGRLCWYRDQRPRFITKHLLPGLEWGGKELLHLYLLPGPSAQPHYHPLLAAQYLTDAFSTFLSAQALAARTC